MFKRLIYVRKCATDGCSRFVRIPNKYCIMCRCRGCNYRQCRLSDFRRLCILCYVRTVMIPEGRGGYLKTVPIEILNEHWA